MPKKIRVSHQGFTRCPSCKAHIAVAPALGDTACPFCDTSLLEALSTSPRTMDRILGSGKSALIAASLLGMPALGACGDDTDDGPTPTDDAGTFDTGPDTQPIPPYGIPGPEDVEADVAPDAPVSEAAYGMPADAFEGPEDSVEAEVAEDIPPIEPYGMPPQDVIESEDATEGEDAAEATDGGADFIPMPPYGMPPDDPDVVEEPTEDATDGDTADDTSDADDVEADTEKEEPTPTPLYGLPPNPSE